MERPPSTSGPPNEKTTSLVERWKKGVEGGAGLAEVLVHQLRHGATARVGVLGVVEHGRLASRGLAGTALRRQRAYR